LKHARYHSENGRDAYWKMAIHNRVVFITLHSSQSQQGYSTSEKGHKADKQRSGTRLCGPTGDCWILQVIARGG